MDEKNQYFSGKHERLMPFLHVQKLSVNYDKKGFSCDRLSDAEFVTFCVDFKNACDMDGAQMLRHRINKRKGVARCLK